MILHARHFGFQYHYCAKKVLKSLSVNDQQASTLLLPSYEMSTDCKFKDLESQKNVSKQLHWYQKQVTS